MSSLKLNLHKVQYGSERNKEPWKYFDIIGWLARLVLLQACKMERTKVFKLARV